MAIFHRWSQKSFWVILELVHLIKCILSIKFPEMRSHRFTMMPWSRIGGTVMKLSDLTLSWLTTQLRNPFRMSERTQDTQISSLVKSLQNHSGQEFRDYVDFSAYFDFHCIWGHFEWSRIPKLICMCSFTITLYLEWFGRVWGRNWHLSIQIGSECACA